MKTFILKALSGAGLMVTLFLAACGNNNCPNGQTMNNGVCTYTNGAYGQQCGAGQVYTQYGCLSQGSCQYGQGYYNGQCIQGTQTGYNQYQYGQQCPAGQILYNGQCVVQNNTGYPTYNGNNGYPNNGYNNGCQQPGFVYTWSYGCLPQQGCPYGMGFGPFGCTY